ncbi:MAG: hypothetical protein H0U86_08885 [Chloroflexi bacterium]|nr:hypothetical protein [Chloroflexota bacterium]
MGLILDLVVVILGLLVIGSLALLAWTLAVSSVRSVGRGRSQVAASRRSIADAEKRLRSSAAEATARLSDLAARTTSSRPEPPGDRFDV